jgi:hypothetical protein
MEPNDDDSVRLAFCRRLKATRERSGVTLRDIAESTKIGPSHLAALERGDLRYWPKGFFRRSFFRGYVGMIGLPVEETLEYFVQLFPEDEATTTSKGTPSRPQSAADAPRLILDTCWHGPTTRLRSRIAASAIDLTVVGFIVVGLAWWTSREIAMIAAIVAISYSTLATIVLGDTPAGWAIRWYPTVRAAVAPSWRRVRVSAQAFFGQGRGSQSDDRVPPQDVETRLRVRFKWSP